MAGKPVSMKRNTPPSERTLGQQVALCSAVAFAAADGVPDWINLLPAGLIRTVDGRGPYLVKSMQTIALGLKAGDKLPIDENHATDKGAVLGLPAPARGWIVELQARDDGLWGRVEWTGEGRRLMEDKAYSGISPAILHSQDKTVLGVLRASLTNTPNLQGLVSLHVEESGMDWKAKLIELLGLDSTADDAAIEAALAAKMKGEGETALCSADVLKLPEVVALQSQVTSLSGQLNTLLADGRREKAEQAVDAAIAAGRVGISAVRENYIALHMSNPTAALAMINAMPAIGGETKTGGLPPAADAAALDATDRQVMALFSVNPEDYAAGLAATGKRVEAL